MIILETRGQEKKPKNKKITYKRYRKMETVKIYVINKGQPSQYFGIAHEDGTVFHYALTYKTEKGAIRYAEKKGYKVIK